MVGFIWSHMVAWKINFDFNITGMFVNRKMWRKVM